MASAEGGMDIEEVAAEHPEKILRETVDPGFGLRSFQARKLAFGLGLTAGFCGSGLVDGSCGSGFSPSTFIRAFRAACSAANASATWAGVASSSAATFFAASKAAWNSSEPDL